PHPPPPAPSAALLVEWRSPPGPLPPPLPLRVGPPPHRRCPVSTGLRAVEERLEVGLQVLRVRCRALSVDAWGAVLPRAAKGLAEPVHVDVMRQRQQADASFLLRQFRYPLELG